MTACSRKIVLLGLAGITWDALAARIAAGRLPATGALVSRGMAGRLRSSVAPTGPAAWATIATGLSPDRHGILASEEIWAGGLRQIGRASWQTDPAWLRLADAGFMMASAGWPATAPGGSWPGLHIDPRFFTPTGKRFDDWLPPLDAAPAAWIERLRDLRVHPTDMTGAMLTPFVPDLAAVDQGRDYRLVELALNIARLSSVHAVAMALIESAPWDALFVHHDWIEQIEARFRNAGPPFERVCDAAWTLLDQLIGAMVTALPGATILLVSPGRHGEAGVIAAAGPDLPRATLRGASTADVAPTLFAWFGLADATLPGSPILPHGTPARPMPPMRARSVPPEPDVADLALVERFGHRPFLPPASWRSRALAAEAELLLTADPAAAAQLAEAALAIDPGSIAALGARAAAHVAMEESEPLPALADRIAAAAPGHLWEALVRAAYHALCGEARLARPLLARVEKEGCAEDRLRAGAAWMMLGRLNDGARLFASVLAVQPDNIAALLGLAAARADRPLEAEGPLRRVLELDPERRHARETLAAMLRRTGRAKEAEALLGQG
jgi:hypothetical protein